MSIPTSGFAALLVVATFALSSCGSDDGTATATTPVAGSGSGSTVVQTVTQTATATTGSTPSTTRTTTPTTTTTKPTPATTPEPRTTSSPGAKTPGAGGDCGPIQIGIRDGEVDETYARITEQQGISCDAASYIVAQWGSQQFGIDRALLPIGWSCSRRNACTNGAARVAFRLEKIR